MRRPLLLLAVLLSATSHARSWWMNPGTMGSNAVAGFAIEPPWTEKYTLFQLGAQAAQGWRYDVSLLPQARLITPFGKWISAYFEGSPVELWWSSPQTREEWLLTKTEGVTKADLRFGFKLMLADLGEGLPKIGFRALTKSTTGKGYEERRFTDGPAYLLEFLVGERLPVQALQLDLLAMGGYWIWQQGESGQNDAITWGLAVSTRSLSQRLLAEVQVRGYVGWQRDDKPVILGLKTGWLFTDWFELTAGVNFGFRDAPRVEGVLYANFRLPLLAPFLFDFTGKGPILAAH
ncbi:MAG: hypothetical protein ACOZQL_14235 [Myxococcota bacterium]